MDWYFFETLSRVSREDSRQWGLSDQYLLQVLMKLEGLREILAVSTANATSEKRKITFARFIPNHAFA